jgi:excisionase family DNA binding protein
MEDIILSQIPLSVLENSISKIVEAQLKIFINPTQPDNAEYITREQAAKLLHISKPTLNALTKEGKLVAYRIGSRVLYKKSEIEGALSKIINKKYKR